MTPRVLFVDHVGVLGGAELSLLDIAAHFKDTSRVVLFSDGPFRHRLEEADVRVEVLAASQKMTQVSREGSFLHDLQAVPAVFGQAWKLARLARRYDVLYANSQKSMITAALAGQLARRPVIWHLRDLMTEEHFSPAHRAVTTLLSRLFIDLVIGNSQATRDVFVQNGGSASRAVAVHNGIDPAPFEQVEPDAVARRREELGLRDVRVVGVFSRLAEWKGQHVLLKALPQLPPDVHVLLVGGALFQEDQRYANQLRREAERLGVQDRVHFLGFRDDIPHLLHLADIVVHTSTAPEPFGRVIVEGMMASKPVVATQAGGAVEILDDGQTGRLVPPGDAEALAHVLNDLLAHPEKAQRLAEAGQAVALARFSLGAMMDRLHEQVTAVAR